MLYFQVLNFREQAVIPQKVEFENPVNPNFHVTNDSDDFFLRDPTDTVDIYYDILPNTLVVTDAKLLIKDESGTTLRTVTLPNNSGDNLLYQWNGMDTDGAGAQFFDEDTFKLELQIEVNGIQLSCQNEHIVTDLVYRHRPIIKYHADDFAKNNGPQHLDSILDHGRLGAGNASLVIERESPPLSTLDLFNNDLSDGFITFAEILVGGTLVPVELPVAERTSGQGPTNIYYIGLTDGDYVFIQYWFFNTASYLPTQNNATAIARYFHEGDWEAFQFTVKLQPTASQIDEKLLPFAGTGSQHFYGQTLKWDDTGNSPSSQNQDYLERVGFQPVIYVADRSHAIYFRKGRFKVGTGPVTNPQFQYDTPAPSWTILDPVDSVADITGDATTIDPVGSHLQYIRNPDNNDDMIDRWTGRWGYPFEVLNGQFAPSSPSFRGPVEKGGSLTYRNAKSFHNSYLKTSQDSPQGSGGIQIP